MLHFSHLPFYCLFFPFETFSIGGDKKKVERRGKGQFFFQFEEPLLISFELKQSPTCNYETFHGMQSQRDLITTKPIKWHLVYREGTRKEEKQQNRRIAGESFTFTNQI